MGTHPLNLIIRFLLEIAALIAIGFWGWHHELDWLRYTLAMGLPVLVAVVWGVFNVPNDPSRSGKAPIIVPGFLRLLIELLIFGAATLVLAELGYVKLYRVMGILVIVHYLASYDRILWLIRH